MRLNLFNQVKCETTARTNVTEKFALIVIKDFVQDAHAIKLFNEGTNPVFYFYSNEFTLSVKCTSNQVKKIIKEAGLSNDKIIRGSL